MNDKKTFVENILMFKIHYTMYYVLFLFVYCHSGLFCCLVYVE